MAGKEKEIVGTMTLPDCEEDEEDDGIADVPPVPSQYRKDRIA